MVYVGDYDKYGVKIWEIWRDWSSRIGFKLSLYAVTQEQVRRIGVTSLHADGYIVKVGPEIFAQKLRERLLL